MVAVFFSVAGVLAVFVLVFDLGSGLSVGEAPGFAFALSASAPDLFLVALDGLIFVPFVSVSVFASASAFVLVFGLELLPVSSPRRRLRGDTSRSSISVVFADDNELSSSPITLIPDASVISVPPAIVGRTCGCGNPASAHASITNLPSASPVSCDSVFVSFTWVRCRCRLVGFVLAGSVVVGCDRGSDDTGSSVSSSSNCMSIKGDRLRLIDLNGITHL